MKKRVNTLHLHPHLLKEVDPNVHPFQPLDQHPGDMTRRPDPGGSDDNGGGGSGRRPPAGGDPGDDSDLDDNPGPNHNPETNREGDSPPLGHSATPAGYDWSQLDMFGWDPNPKCIQMLGEHISEMCNNTFRGQICKGNYYMIHCP
jgi:hypothetical protein